MNHFEVHIYSIYPMPKRHLVKFFWQFPDGNFFLVDICIFTAAAAATLALAAVGIAAANLRLGAIHHELDAALHLHDGLLGLGARLRDEAVNLLEELGRRPRMLVNAGREGPHPPVELLRLAHGLGGPGGLRVDHLLVLLHLRVLLGDRRLVGRHLGAVFEYLDHDLSHLGVVVVDQIPDALLLVDDLGAVLRDLIHMLVELGCSLVALCLRDAGLIFAKPYLQLAKHEAHLLFGSAHGACGEDLN